MPHILIDHNDRHGLDIDALVGALHDEASRIDALPLGGLRTRAFAPTHSRVADGHTDNAYVYVMIRIGHGRSDAVRQEIGERLMAVLNEWAAPAHDAGHPLSLGLEVQEIAPGTTWKKNNLHQILKDRT